MQARSGQQQAAQAQNIVALPPAQRAEAVVPVPALIASAAPSSVSASSFSSDAQLDRSRTQLLSAVSSLLQQAQLPLSLESASLVRDNLSLRQQFEAADRRASEAHARESALNSRIERLQSAFTCVICQNQEVDVILVSCGHMVSQTSDELQHTILHGCAAVVVLTIVLLLSLVKLSLAVQVCSTCEGQLRNRTCPFCRKHYSQTIPFFKPSNGL